jgi:hypothetical protein
MIRYLTHKHQDIIRICLSHPTSSITESKPEATDPETVLNTVETFLNSLSRNRLELQHHLRKRLIPVKQAAWKSSQGGDIDPFDIIFNLDILEPVLGEGDVVVNGRSFSITEVEITTLEPTANVEENAILLGGLYSMRRIIAVLLHDINAGFPDNKITINEREYESLNAVLLRLASVNMKKRCEQQLLQLEEFIRYFERKIGVSYQGECRPVMTSFVRSSRVYRRLFEQLHEWYTLGTPSIGGRSSLAKLRSISKIYEFVALFKLIDYLYINNWTVTESDWLADLEFVPSRVLFQQNNLTITLTYETKIFPYHHETSHFDLVDMSHIDPKEHNYKYRCPDFVLRLDDINKTIYVILDAKYSSAWTIKTYRLVDLYDKYFVKMAVYDAYNQYLKQNAILAVIALFPDKNALPVYMPHWGNYGINKQPLRLPIVMGLPILPTADTVAYSALDRILEIAQRQLKDN